MNNRLFDRGPQTETASEPSIDEMPTRSLDHSDPVAVAGFGNRTEDRIEQLEADVDHLRICIDQLLDIIERQPDHTDELLLLGDRTSFVERRMQRIEDGFAEFHRSSRRRAGDL